MDSILLFLSYFFAGVIICLALYFLYCWNKDQQLQEENREEESREEDPASFDMIDKSNDRDSNLT